MLVTWVLGSNFRWSMMPAPHRAKLQREDTMFDEEEHCIAGLCRKNTFPSVLVVLERKGEDIEIAKGEEV